MVCRDGWRGRVALPGRDSATWRSLRQPPVAKCSSEERHPPSKRYGMKENREDKARRGVRGRGEGGRKGAGVRWRRRVPLDEDGGCMEGFACLGWILSMRASAFIGMFGCVFIDARWMSFL